MRKSHWKALAIAAVLMMAVPALQAMAADKAPKHKPAPKAAEQSMPGCTMHGGAGMETAKPGCGAKGEMGKDMAGCSKRGADMKGCCKSGDMKGCGMKGGMGKGMAGCGMQGGGMKGCEGKGEMGKGMAGCCMQDGGMMGCGMKGGMAKVVVCRSGPGGDMPGCGMKGGMGQGMGGGMMCGPGMRGGPMGPGMECGPGPMMLRGLDLTPEQQKKVEAIHGKQARLMVQAEADLRIATMDLQQLMRDEKPDQARIDAQIDKIAEVKTGMAKARIATMLEVRALLTPEQLKKWQAGPMMGGEEDD